MVISLQPFRRSHLIVLAQLTAIYTLNMEKNHPTSVSFAFQSTHGDFKTYNESYAATFQKAVAAKIGHNVDQPNDLLGLQLTAIYTLNMEKNHPTSVSFAFLVSLT